MNNEIKEILDELSDKDVYINNETLITLDEAKILLDYINNLQTIEQQYSAILSENAELENKITNLQERNEKAIEYIEKESWFCYKDDEEVIARTPVEELLKILKGE